MDEDLRRLEKAHRANPDDAALLQRFIAATRRSGERVPGWMIERELQPPRRFESRRPFQVYAELAGGEVIHLGETPGGVDVPEHQAWWVVPPKLGKELPGVIAELQAQDVAGLGLDRSQINDEGLAELRDVPKLNWLSLASCNRISDDGLVAVARNVPQLRRLTLDNCARNLSEEGIESLQECKDLVQLYVRNRTPDHWIPRIVAAAPRLTRLRIGGKQLTNAGLRALEPLEDLARLEVSFSGRVSNVGLDAISKKHELTHLDLIGCTRMQNDALEIVSRFRKLESFGFYPSGRFGLLRGVNDKEILHLAALGALESLRSLRIVAMGVIAPHRVQLEKALPRVTVVFLENYREYWDQISSEVG